MMMIMMIIIIIIMIIIIIVIIAIGSRNQANVGVNRKMFLRTDRIAQTDFGNFVNFWVMNCKINLKKIPCANNFFL